MRISVLLTAARACAVIFACLASTATANTGVPITHHHFHRLVQDGDASVVPVLIKALNEASRDARLSNPPTEVSSAVVYAGEARLRGMRRVLIGMHDKSSSSRLRGEIVEAVARIGAPDTADFLSKAVEDRSLPVAARCEAAVTLLDIIDSEPARKLLLAEVHSALDSQPGPVQLPSCLGRCSDAGVAAGLRDVAPRQNRSGNRQRLEDLAARIDASARVLSFNASQLLSAAGDARWEHQHRRLRAIEVLGERGTPAAIEVLRSPSPWTDCPVPGQDAPLHRACKRATALIRLRHSEHAIAADANRDPATGHAQRIAPRTSEETGIMIIKRGPRR